MSAGRIRYLAPGEKGPKSPAFRLRFENGSELVLTEAGKKKRGGRLARDSRADRGGAGAPRAGGARTSTPRGCGRSSTADNRRLHPLLRDQRALAGIGRAHANEILWRARLSPFALSTQLADERGRAARRRDRRGLTRALELRLRGRATRTSISSTAASASRARAAATPLRRQVDYEEHTVFYCARLPDGRPRPQRPPPLAPPALVCRDGQGLSPDRRSGRHGFPSGRARACGRRQRPPQPRRHERATSSCSRSSRATATRSTTTRRRRRGRASAGSSSRGASPRGC